MIVSSNKNYALSKKQIPPARFVVSQAYPNRAALARSRRNVGLRLALYVVSWNVSEAMDVREACLE